MSPVGEECSVEEFSGERCLVEKCSGRKQSLDYPSDQGFGFGNLPVFFRICLSSLQCSVLSCATVQCVRKKNIIFQ